MHEFVFGTEKKFYRVQTSLKTCLKDIDILVTTTFEKIHEFADVPIFVLSLGISDFENGNEA